MSQLDTLEHAATPGGPHDATVRHPLAQAVRARIPQAPSPLDVGQVVSRGAVLGVLALAAALLPVLLVLHRQGGSARLPAAAALAAAIVVCEIAAAPSKRAALRSGLRPIDAFLAACLAWAPGNWVVVGVGLGVLVLALVRRRAPLAVVWTTERDLLFASSATLVALHIEGHHLLAAIVGSLAGGTVLALIGMTHRQIVGGPFDGVRFSAGAMQFLTMISLGSLAGAVVPQDPALLVVLLLPAYAIVREHTARSLRQDEVDLYADVLAQLSQTEDERGLAAATRAIVDAAVLVFGPAARVTVTALTPEHQHTLIRTPDGVVHRYGETVSPLSPQALLALGGAAPVTNFEGHTATFAAALGAPDEPAVVLETQWPAHRGLHLRQTVRLATSMAALGSEWLRLALVDERAVDAERRAARMPVALPSEAVVALDTLQEATAEVTRLSEHGAGDHQALVAELDTAARAVAALVGALSHGPDERPRREVAPQAEPSVDLGPPPAGTT